MVVLLPLPVPCVCAEFALVTDLKPWAYDSYAPVRNSTKLKTGVIMAFLTRFGNYLIENM